MPMREWTQVKALLRRKEGSAHRAGLGRLAQVLFAAIALTSRSEAQPRIPQTAVSAVKAYQDAMAKSGASTYYNWYFWCPAASKEEHATVKLIANAVLSRTSDDVRPIPIAGGAVLAVDLSRCVDNESQLPDLLSLRVRLAEMDPYFHTHSFNYVSEFRDEPCAPYVHTDGKTYRARRVEVGRKSTVVTEPSPLLGRDMVAVEEVGGVGCLTSVAFAASRLLIARDDGLYYQARGLVKGKTALNEYLQSRGVDLKNIDRTNAEDIETMISGITGGPRSIVFRSSSLVKPTQGSPACSVTNDIFEANAADPQKDAFRSLLDQKPDGHEVMVRLPNGQVEWTLFGGDGKLIDVAPQNLVADRNVPAPFPTQLSPPMSCIRCHGPDENWKPFRQEFKEGLADRARLLTDLSKGAQGQFEQRRKLEARTRGNTDFALKWARDTDENVSQRVTGMGIVELSDAVWKVYSGYVYGYVTAREMLYDLGISPEPDDEFGVLTFRKVVPPKSEDGSIPDDQNIIRLRTLAELNTGKRAPQRITRRQAEVIFQECMYRALPNLKEAARVQIQRELNPHQQVKP